MKKLSIALSLAVIIFTAPAFAAGGNETAVYAKVKSSFKKDFSAAENINWQKRSNVFFVSFDVNNILSEAAYNEEGELLGVSRQIPSTELPLVVSMSIAKKYVGYEVAKSATEISFDNQTNYYINVGNDSQLLTLKCNNSGEITVDKKKKK